MSGMRTVVALSALTLPPYSTASPRLHALPPSAPRINPCTACACRASPSGRCRSPTPARRRPRCARCRPPSTLDARRRAARRPPPRCARLALGERLADAHDRHQAGASAAAPSRATCASSRHAALAAPSGRRSRSDTELGEHRRRYLAGVGARACSRQSCAPHATGRRRAAPATAPDRANGTHTARAGAARAPCSSAQQRPVGRRLAVHFPVADDELPASARRGNRPRYHASTSLPMWRFDSISSCARGASAAGKTSWMTGLTRPASSHRPHGLAERGRDRALERHRPRPQRRAGDRQPAAQHEAGVEASPRRRLARAMTTTRPSSARHLTSRPRYSPATMSRMTLAPCPPVRRKTSATKSWVL